LKKDLCTNSVDELTKYIFTFINDPKIGNGDKNTYFENIFDILKNHSNKVYFEILKTSHLYKEQSYTKAGANFGELLLDIFNIKPINDDMSTWPNSKNYVEDKNVFETDSKKFKTRIIFCINSLEKILPDIFNFYDSKVKGFYEIYFRN